MIIITVANAKGGVSKTTTALCLAEYLAGQGNKTLVLDVDPQANATDTLLRNKIGNFIEGQTLYDVLENFLFNKKEIDINKIVRPAPGIENLFIIPAALEMEILKGSMKDRPLEPLYTLNNILKKLNPYGYIIIDCPADLSVFVENSIKIADLVLVPTTNDDYGIRALNMILPLVLKIKGEAFNDFRILYTLFNARATKIEKKITGFVKKLEKEKKIIPFRIPVDQQVRNWQSDSNLNFMTDKVFEKSKARQAYIQLGEYIMKGWK
jgi:chromosome partitioning protein